MDISISEFQALTNERVTQTMRTAELERRLAEKTDECEKLRGEVEHLKLENTAAQIENIWLKNYITLSVERIRGFVKQLRTIDRFAFLKTFLECVLPREHYQEQQMLVNEVLTLPEEQKPQVRETHNHYVTMTGSSATYTENNNAPDQTNKDS